MHPPKYSLLLPVRNEAGRIGAVVEAVFADLEAHAGRDGWEVCFGDDFSTDGTREKLQGLSARFPFRLVAPAANIGRGPIRNLLGREARGETLVFLDGDCIPEPGYFRAWEDLVAESSAWLGRTAYEQSPASGFSRFLDRGTGVGKRTPSPRRAPSGAGEGPVGIHPALFISQNFRIPRALFLEVGGFRGDLSGWGGEDTDFGYKLAARGTPLRYAPAAQARHPSVTAFAAYLARLEDFGRVNMPLLVRDYPAIGDRFQLSKAGLPWSALLLNPLAAGLCKALLTRLGGWPWPFAFYRFAIFNAYASGWRRRARSPVRRARSPVRPA